MRNEKECVCSKIMSECVCSKIIKELPGLVGNGTPYIIRRMRFKCCITKATNLHRKYVILVAFPRRSAYAKAPQCYVYGTLPVLLNATNR